MKDKVKEHDLTALLNRIDEVTGIAATTQSGRLNARAYGYAEQDERTYADRQNAGLWFDNC